MLDKANGIRARHKRRYQATADRYRGETMEDERYIQIISEFCRDADLGDPDDLLKTGQLRIGEYEVEMQPIRVEDRSLLSVEVDFGEVPLAYQTEIYRELLTTNLFLGVMEGARLGIRPDNGHALYVERLRLDTVASGADLSTILKDCVIEAAVWRDKIWRNVER